MATNPSIPTPHIAALGLASWNDIIVVDRSPAGGACAIVRDTASLSGGSTTNSAVALARLGARVSIAAFVGDDASGTAIRDALTAEKINTEWLATRPGEATDRSTIVVARESFERTIYRHQGARLVRGDRLYVAEIFAHDLVLLDLDDPPLLRFLIDLPAHTAPAARLLGTLTYLVDSGLPDAFDLALRHDAIVGSEREICALTGARSAEDALKLIQRSLPGANLRACFVSRGSNGASGCTATEIWHEPAFPITAIDTTGAGDAFAAGIAYGMARRWPWPRATRFANAVGALSTRALGAQSALPRPAEVASLLATDLTTLLR